MFKPGTVLVSVTVGTSAVNLLQALRGLAGYANLPATASYLMVEFDILASGNLYGGNSGVATNNCGFHLVPSQYKPYGPIIPGGLTGMLTLGDIYLLCDTAGQQVNITIIPFGD